MKPTCIKSLLSLGLFHVKTTTWKVQITFINKSILQRSYSGLQAHHQYFWWSHQAPIMTFRWSSYNSKTKHTQFSPWEHLGTEHSPSTNKHKTSWQLSQARETYKSPFQIIFSKFTSSRRFRNFFSRCLFQRRAAPQNQLECKTSG